MAFGLDRLKHVYTEEELRLLEDRGCDTSGIRARQGLPRQDNSDISGEKEPVQSNSGISSEKEPVQNKQVPPKRENSKTYSPDSPVKHHCETKNISDEEYGDLVEIIKTNIPLLAIKALFLMGLGVIVVILSSLYFSKDMNISITVAAVVFFYGVYFICSMKDIVMLFKDGMIVNKLFSKKRISYSNIKSIDIFKTTDKVGNEADYRMDVTSIIKRTLRTYTVCRISTYVEKPIELKAQTYHYMKEKMGDLKENLNV